MIRLNPQTIIDKQSLNQRLYQCYLLIGEEPLQLTEVQDAILLHAKTLGFNEINSLSITHKTEWNSIFAQVQSLSLFSPRQTLILNFYESGITAAIAEKLTILFSLLHEDILLLLQIKSLTKAQEQSKWFKTLPENSAQINCYPIDSAKLPQWVMFRAKQIGLTLDKESLLLICHDYEGNLLALSQALEQLSLLYPDGKLTLPRLEKTLHNASVFSTTQWIEAIWQGKSQRVTTITRKLKENGVELIYLMRSLQKDLMLLIELKEHKETVKLIFDKYHVWQNRRSLLLNAMNRLNKKQLNESIQVLLQLEIAAKQGQSALLWQQLDALSLYLSGKQLVFNYVK